MIAQKGDACASPPEVDPERRATVAGLRHLLAPSSVAVIGASRHRGKAGRVILDSIRDAGYTGQVYAVNPRARQINGERCLASAGELPGHVDLAVIAVPAEEVPGVVEQCGQRGVGALMVITAGLGIAAEADLLATCRRHGMRLVGPNCFGVAVPGARLDATCVAYHPVPGKAGIVAQSGDLGLALASRLSRLGIGISSFASVGDKLDVSGNDLLTWWEQDQETKLAVLYTESFGNPRTFARTARRVGASMPVLAVLAERAATLSAERAALFQQAGVIVTRSVGELLETAALMASQPVPAGSTVAIVTNASGAGKLAVGACTANGLTVYQPRGLSRRGLNALIPETGTLNGLIDATPAIAPDRFRRVLELAAADEEVSAMIAVVLAGAVTGDLVTAIRQAQVGVPLTAVVLEQAEPVRLLPGGDGQGQIPAYAYPEAAATALARAAKYGAWRASQHGAIPKFEDIETERARTVVREFLRRAPDGGWLPADQVTTLLGCYGIPIAHGGAGTEVSIGVTHDRVLGPLVAFGLGGAASHVRITPLTGADADALIRPIRSVPPQARRDSSVAGLAALRDLLLRVGRLAGDLPEITDLGLSPVIVRPDGAFVVDGRVKVMRHQRKDPFLRGL